MVFSKKRLFASLSTVGLFLGGLSVSTVNAQDVYDILTEVEKQSLNIKQQTTEIKLDVLIDDSDISTVRIDSYEDRELMELELKLAILSPLVTALTSTDSSSLYLNFLLKDKVAYLQGLDFEDTTKWIKYESEDFQEYLDMFKTLQKSISEDYAISRHRESFNKLINLTEDDNDYVLSFNRDLTVDEVYDTFVTSGLAKDILSMIEASYDNDPEYYQIVQSLEDLSEEEVKEQLNSFLETTHDLQITVDKESYQVKQLRVDLLFKEDLKTASSGVESDIKISLVLDVIDQNVKKKVIIPEEALNAETI